MNSAAPLLTPHPAQLQFKRRTHAGHFFVGAQAVYFLSTADASAWWGAVGSQLGAVGAVIKAVGEHALYQDGAIQPAPENVVAQATSSSPTPIVLTAADTEFIKYTWWMRAIRWRGQTIGVGKGLAPELREDLRAWAQRVGVPIKGKL